MQGRDENAESVAVDIALACFNGAQYLPPLLDSLRAQTHDRWNLVARDDQSSDVTTSILLAFQKESENSQIVPSDTNLGAVKNFEQALLHTTADYILLADQDDVWREDKVELCLGGIRALEKAHGKQTPALYFTDLEVVDENLAVQHPSFWAYEKIQVESCHSLGRLLVRNTSPGCSMILNRALLEKALPLPDEVVMHDWWLLLVAALFGKIDYSPEATVRYRQHGQNVEGAKRRSLLEKSFRFVFKYAEIKSATRATQSQAQSLLDAYGDTLDFDARETLMAYCNSRRESGLKHRWRCYRQGISSRGLISNLGLYWVL
ncbi:MAG: glycosyltransferase family 2 protein [Pirellulales bacterium]|nr:glycosyltransferase family 2 protein [Pirellulales bacterium]